VVHTTYSSIHKYIGGYPTVKYVLIKTDGEKSAAGRIIVTPTSDFIDSIVVVSTSIFFLCLLTIIQKD